MPLAKHLSTKFILAAALCLLALWASKGLVSQEKKPVETDAADKDYAAELPEFPRRSRRMP